MKFGYLKRPHVEVKVTENVRFPIAGLSHYMHWGSKAYKEFSPAYDFHGEWGDAP